MWQKKILLVAMLFILFNVSFAQDVTGRWTTFDAKGKLTGEIELYLQNDLLYGKVTRAFLPDGTEVPDITCDGCIDGRDGQKIVGMIIVGGLTYNPKKDEYYGDKLCFSAMKNVLADGKIWIDKKDKDIVYIRGYMGPFYETQKWKRVK